MRLPLRHPSTSRFRLALGSAIAAGLLVSVGAAPLSASAAPAATHYVNCAAKTNGDGSSEAKAWNSISSVTKHGGFTAGDKILFKRGTTCKGQLAPTGSGTATARNVIGAYGTGARPTIAGGGTANNTGAVQIINQQYWTVQDLHITNATKSANPTTYRSGLLFFNSGVGRLAGLTAQRLWIENVRSNPGNGNTRAYGGISALTFGTMKSGFDSLRILNNTVRNVSRTGIISSNAQYPKAYDKDTRIAGNTVSHARGDGIVLIGAQHGRIDDNVVANVGDLGSCAHCGRYGGPSTASAGIWPSSARYITIDHNEVYGTRKAGGDGEAFDIDRSSRDVTIQYNYAHDNQGGGVLLTGARDSTIRFNILENNGQGALTFYGKAPSTNTSFYNNTVYLSKASKAKVVRTFGAIKGSKVSFKNNLVYSYGAGQYQWPTKKVTTAANTLLGPLGVGRPRDAKTSFVNPGLKAPGTGKTGFKSLKGYKPKHPSSFKRGVAIPKSVKVDIFGKKINPAKPPRGAAG
ncbi:right-handed parallel beta-helix repeat-containing protein [uncultured Amnibacterium sp.]|uniref:right-handed parallel beta-helix repeat-containing protein n=1 Tax=uncultured Amnibacterium sp. TaxID=1631851 RepID=UPI0035CC3B86